MRQLDLGADDRMMWISDMGWVVGALTAVSTSFGGGLMLVEGSPDYPDLTRHWRVMQENDVTFGCRANDDPRHDAIWR